MTSTNSSTSSATNQNNNASTTLIQPNNNNTTNTSTITINNPDIQSNTSITTTHHSELNIPRSENLLPPGTIHDEIEIEDFQFNPETGIFTYPCPCGDIFQISVDELKRGEELAKCPSCSLVVKVIYDEEDFDFETDDEEEDDSDEEDED